MEAPPEGTPTNHPSSQFWYQLHQNQELARAEYRYRYRLQRDRYRYSDICRGNYKRVTGDSFQARENRELVDDKVFPFMDDGSIACLVEMAKRAKRGTRKWDGDAGKGMSFAIYLVVGSRGVASNSAISANPKSLPAE
ncbi:hypothetical protein KQX54_016987 [Cotesia glomerata]|uniref:Uncharacterized protein n=1 Tax=Cotesia glomerata TaxID=32391 RepID=A0AAV7IA52_COTGL|nr:hypothetical protein KQX54_016987 [Cotesia glomerata]